MNVLWLPKSTKKGGKVVVRSLTPTDSWEKI